MSTEPKKLRSIFNEEGSVEKIALGGLNYINGNESPYFSLSYFQRGISEENSSKESMVISYGIDHEELVSIWPELKPLADIHLSSIDGVPLHALHNGWHFLAGAAGGLGERYCALNPSKSGVQRSELDCLTIFSKHCRIDIETARDLVQRVISVFEKTGSADAKDLFSKWIDDQKIRWKIEANSVINNLGLEVFGDIYHWNGNLEDKKTNPKMRNKP